MRITDTRRYDMLVRVRDFGDTYGHLFPESSVARQQFATVAAAIKELTAHDLTLMRASVAARADRKAHSRQALLDRLGAMSRTARVLAGETPGLDSQFQLPRSITDQGILTATRKFARDAEQLAARFIAQGMATTFVADLEALGDAFERAMRDRGIGRAELVASRANTQATMANAVAAVRSLSAIVINHLNGDAVTRAVWDRISRIAYPERAPKPVTTPEPTAATATPAPEVTA